MSHQACGVAPGRGAGGLADDDRGILNPLAAACLERAGLAGRTRPIAVFQAASSSRRRLARASSVTSAPDSIGDLLAAFRRIERANAGTGDRAVMILGVSQ